MQVLRTLLSQHLPLAIDHLVVFEDLTVNRLVRPDVANVADSVLSRPEVDLLVLVIAIDEVLATVPVIIIT